MTRPTLTRAQLRRAIAIRLMMPFSRRVPDGYATATGGSTITLIDTVNLGQPDDYWNGQWVYRIETGEVRKVTDFLAYSDTIKLEYAMTTAITSSDTYEIHSPFSAIEIHEAINQAITSSYPAFFETVEDDSLVVCEDKLEYDLTSISPSVGLIHELALERPTTRLYADIVSASSGVTWSIVLNDTDVGANATTDWYFSIFDGLGRGTVSPVLTADSDTITVTDTDIIGTPSASDKCMLWDAAEEKLGWYRMKHVHFSSKEWPSYLRLYAPIYGYRGSRLRIKYSTVPSTLTAETSTTVVPQEYIIPKAISILAKTRVGDNRVDRQRYAILADEYNKEAELYKARNFFRLPDMDMFMEGRDLPDELTQDPKGDPLGWR